jgi:homoserine O-acetyltransferase
MKDEYSNMSSAGEVWTCPGDFALECGQSLRECEVGYNTYGTLNATRDNAIFACHALTGNSQVDTWWGGLIGPGKAVDTEKYFVISANVLASCYGTTGPKSIDPATGEPYGPSFPAVTIRDTVRLHRRLVFEHLGVRSLALVVGGSMGGMQALEWLLLSETRGPEGELDVRRGIVIACGAAHTSWQIGISETQRQAIFSDPRWNGGSYEKTNPPTTGLMIARQIAMITYRTSAAYQTKFVRNEGGLSHRGLGLPKFPRLPSDDGSKWEVQTYLEHQGEKFRYRFDPLTYVRLTALMDTQDVGRGRGGVEEALRSIRQPVAIVGINSDVLYPIDEQQELVRQIPSSEMWLVDSLEGHDAFILETDQIGKVCSRMLESQGWVPRRDTTTYCLSFGKEDASAPPMSQQEQEYHERQAAAHRTLGTFHEQLKNKPKTVPPFWL